MRRNRSRQSAFTLVEMLIVIVILGILAMIIIPQLTQSTDEARVTTLQTNLSAMRSGVEYYFAQHASKYPGDALPTTRPADITSVAEAFVGQMTRYTDIDGNISNTKTNAFTLGPYVKGGALPVNPFNELDDITVDTATADITAKDSTGAGTGWKFYSKTGVLIAADGAHDNL